MPKVSIVIPLYNKGPYILRAIRSVLSQKEQDFEVIVINDASTDGGEMLVANLRDSRIKLFSRDKPGAGGYQARNEGIKRATTDLIAFLDADDIWTTDFLETILRLRRNYPDAGLYATAYKIREKNGRFYIPKYNAIPKRSWEGLIENYFESVLGEPPVWTSAASVPKDVFSACGSFPIKVSRGGDLDTWLRIALKYPIAFSNQICAVYQRDAKNRVCEKKSILREPAISNTIHDACASRVISEKNKTFLKEYLNLANLDIAIDYISSGNSEYGRKKLVECQTVYFKKRKEKWLTLSKLPFFVLKFIIFVKVNLIERLKK